MSEAIEPGLWRRIRMTPMRDLLRLRLSGRLDWRHAVSSADLPAPAQELILKVVRKTWLWRMEKTSVARELVSHFADAIEAGVPADRAIEKFGDPRQAAKLIRRAKIRNRPYLWHAYKWLRRLALAMVVFYIGAGVYFYMGKPKVSVDYLAKINAPILAVPADQYAWPIYREAATGIDEFPEPNDGPPFVTDEEWNRMAAWLDRHADAVETIRRAASKPVFGAPLRFGIAPEDRLMTSSGEATSMSPGGVTSSKSPVDDTLIAVLLPHLNYMRYVSIVLNFDARVAARKGDGARVERDIETLLRMSDHLRKHDVFITDLVAIGIRAMALELTADMLHDYPDLLESDALRRLAHRLSGPTVPADFIAYQGERYTMYDIVQRCYTDDGAGNGRLTPDGIRFFQRLQPLISTGDSNEWSNFQILTIQSLGPGLMLASASRRDLLQVYDQYMDVQEAALHRNLRDDADFYPEAQIIKMKTDPYQAVKYGLIGVLAPSLSRARVAAERHLAMQEADTARIGLELYKRETGAYPDSLQALVPKYLPSVPADRIDGQPMRYKLVKGKPLLYSVGVDRKDDGGRRPRKENGKLEHAPVTAEWRKSAPVVDGDWVLIPILREKE